jgi:hypothetical protein
MASSYVEYVMASSYVEYVMASSYVEYVMESSYVEYVMASSYVEYVMAISYVEYVMASSYVEYDILEHKNEMERKLLLLYTKRTSAHSIYSRVRLHVSTRGSSSSGPYNIFITRCFAHFGFP